MIKLLVTAVSLAMYLAMAIVLVKFITLELELVQDLRAIGVRRLGYVVCIIDLALGVWLFILGLRALKKQLE